MKDLKDIKFYGVFPKTATDNLYTAVGVGYDLEDVKDIQSEYPDTEIIEIDFVDYYNLLIFLNYDVDLELEALFNQPSEKTYLVVLFNSRWNGASGFRLNVPLKHIFSRDYDVSIRDFKMYKRGKMITWVESSHDCPTGAPAFAYRLTKEEAKKLETTPAQKVIQLAQDEYWKVTQND